MAEMIQGPEAEHGWSGTRTAVTFPRDWFNGQVWLLSRPEDFDLPGEDFAKKLRIQARKYGRNMRCKRIGEDKIKVQAYA